jgi:hypothetical protein
LRATDLNRENESDNDVPDLVSDEEPTAAHLKELHTVEIHRRVEAEERR